MKKTILIISLFVLLFSVQAVAEDRGDTLTVVTIVRTGLTPGLDAVTDDTTMFVNDGKTFLQIANTGAEMTATLVSTASDWRTLPAGTAESNGVVTIVQTSGVTMVGPFPKTSYNDANGYVTVVYSRISDVTNEAYTIDE